jgi:hypothetical protein
MPWPYSTVTDAELHTVPPESGAHRKTKEMGPAVRPGICIVPAFACAIGVPLWRTTHAVAACMPREVHETLTAWPTEMLVGWAMIVATGETVEETVSLAGEFTGAAVGGGTEEPLVGSCSAESMPAKGLVCGYETSSDVLPKIPDKGLAEAVLWNITAKTQKMPTIRSMTTGTRFIEPL